MSSTREESFVSLTGESELVDHLEDNGLLYALNLLVLQAFGLSLSRIDSDELSLRQSGEAEALLDALAHREGLEKLGNRELDALLVGVREGEARLTRELERRKQVT